MLALSRPVGNSSGSFGELSHSLLLNAVRGIKGSMLYFLTEPSLRVDFGRISFLAFVIQWPENPNFPASSLAMVPLEPLLTSFTRIALYSRGVCTSPIVMRAAPWVSVK